MVFSVCFAQRLKDLMDSTGTTNYQLAKAVGCHQTTVANILAGSNPQARTKQAIANYFNVAVSFLTGETDDPTEQPAATERDQKEKPPANGEELIPGYSDLTEENKAKARDYIDLLLGSQQNG